MKGRDLTESNGNLLDIDISLRGNIHNKKAYIYGIQQEKSLNSKLKMFMKTAVDAKVILLLKSKIKQSLHVNDIKLMITKYLSMKNKAKLSCDAAPNINKQLKAKSEIIMCFEPVLTVLAKLKTKPINQHFTTDIKAGLYTLTKISDVEDIYISDLENKYISNLYKTKVI